MKIKKLLVFMFALLLGLNLLAQQRSITGNVSDEIGPLPGVTVVVKGTTSGTITDTDGNFTLSVNEDAEILVFSFVGMATKEVSIEGKSNLQIVMEAEAIGLEEVVAIGYGTVKKSDLTGSVGSVKGVEVAARQSTQTSQALQGAVSGVMVTRDNNAPGATASIRVRGVTTIGDSDPLIIVDGIPASSINDVNPNDIESISVLKDAASASIYGSRAAAGVILITTKRANSGELKLNYNFEYGIEKPTEIASYVGAQRYMEVVNELRWNDNGNIEGGEFPVYTEDVVTNYSSLHQENPDLYPDTDWVDLILADNSSRQSHVLNITAGTEKLRTKVSLAYDNSEGLFMNKSYERFTARFNNDMKINKYISASANIYAKRSISENPVVDPIEYMFLTPAIYAAEWSNGLIAEGKAGSNIYGMLKEGGYKDYTNNQLGGKLSIDITPIEGLKISAVVAPELNNNKVKSFTKKVQYTDYEDPEVYVSTLAWASSTSLSESRSDNYHVTTQFFANYNRSIGLHSLNVMGGYENYYKYSESLTSETDQMELSEYEYLDLGNENYLSSSGNAYENAYRSLFGRVMYSFNKKYLLQGNIRYDGSSRFASDYRWGAFPSFSAGWVVSEEPFMEGLSNLSFLKLRASWGTLGNSRMLDINGNPDYYPYQASINYGSALLHKGTGVVSALSAAQYAYAVENLTWETTETVNVGLDATLFDNRLRIGADYYEKVTKDMLLELEVPDYAGYDNPLQNTGKMNTKGWELEIGWNDKIGDLSYSISANVSDSKSVMGRFRRN